jgi:Clp amino terminal domain, pathogenicity island component
MTISERLYRILLKAYPRRYRERYEQPMAECFRDQLRSTSGLYEFFRLWLRTLADHALTVPARHLEPGPSAMYSKGARSGIFYAAYEARAYRRREVLLEDLLLGILRENHGLLSAEIVEGVRADLAAAEGTRRHVPPAADIRIGFEARRALEGARAIATACGAAQVSASHILKAILQQEDSRAARLLREQGIDIALLGE